MQSLAGKPVVFLDTCHSCRVLAGGGRRGTVDVGVLANELASAENGVMAYAFSTGREVSQEHANWRTASSS